MVIEPALGVQGLLATGDCKAGIHVWHAGEGGSWSVDAQPYKGHTASVEDIEWSPVEANVFLSSSCDSTMRVWDVRRKDGAALCVHEGHDFDVNVVSWNRRADALASVHTRVLGLSPATCACATRETPERRVCRNVNYLVASGADDGTFRIWDLRTFSQSEAPTPVAKFNWHKAAITSIEWSPQASASSSPSGVPTPQFEQ